jgi:hypothetical protein
MLSINTRQKSIIDPYIFVKLNQFFDKFLIGNCDFINKNYYIKNRKGQWDYPNSLESYLFNMHRIVTKGYHGQSKDRSFARDVNNDVNSIISCYQKFKLSKDNPITIDDYAIAIFFHAQWHLSQKVAVDINEFCIDLLLLDMLNCDQKLKENLQKLAILSVDSFLADLPQSFKKFLNYNFDRLSFNYNKSNKQQFDFYNQLVIDYEQYLESGYLGEYAFIYANKSPKASISQISKSFYKKIINHMLQSSFCPNYIEKLITFKGH